MMRICALIIALLVQQVIPSCELVVTEAAADTSFTTDALPASPPLADAGDLALEPGHDLPSDEECADQVVATAESRNTNARFNQTRGRQKHLSGPYLSRVSGDFVGTTDEIIQWSACKWG